MAVFQACKVVTSLPGTLAANTIYLVRQGAGFRPHVTNSSGTITAYPLDPIAWSELTGKPAFGNASLAGASPLQCGRLTLTTGIPVTTFDVTGASTIYFTPWRGNVVSIFDGSHFVPFAFSELSRSLSGLTSGKNYDVFAYLSSGSVVIDLAPAWTNDSTRATGVFCGQGIWVNDAQFTGVMGGVTVSQYRATLLGTIRTTGTNTTEDSLLRGFVANVLHPAPKRLRINDATSHTYNTATTRPYRNLTSNRVEWVTPLAERPATGYLTSAVQHPNAGAPMYTGIGLDSTTVINTTARMGLFGNVIIETAAGHTMPVLAAGYHYFQMLQQGSGSGTNSFFESTIDAEVWL